MNTREREVMDALALAARRSLEWIEDRDLACNCGNPTCRTNALRSSVAAYAALLAEGSASSEGEQRITVADVARLIECKVADVLRAGRNKCSLMLTANQMVSVEDAVLLARWTLHEQRSCEGSERRPIARNEVSAIADEASIAVAIACELARIDGFEPEDENGGLYDLRWSSGASPEPLGDAWAMDYLPKGERIANALKSAHPRGLPAGSEVELDVHLTDQNTVCVDAQHGTKRQFSIGVTTDGEVWFAAYIDGDRYNGKLGKHAFAQAIRSAYDEEMAERTLATAEQPPCGQVVRNAARYLYLRDFPPRARAEKEGNTQPSLNDMWVSAFVNPTPGMIPTIDILEGDALDARIDAAIAAQQRQGGAA